MDMDRRDAAMLVSSIVLCELVGALGSVFSIAAIPKWYAGLAKPQFLTPPSWVFGPVWTALYLMMGVSLYLLWRNGPRAKGARAATEAFGAQLMLNLLWSFLFFGLRSPLLGLAGIVLLWAAILATIVRSYRVSRAAAAIMVPYLLWVTFAALLNFYVFILN
jgi:tryptophan-rich sensory protein